MSELDRRTNPEVDEVLSEDSARAVWRRAAQLQAEAARAADDHDRPLAVRDEGPVASAGFRASEVEAAAAEAGIAPEFVKLALLESRGSAAGAGVAQPVPRWLDRATTHLIGTDRRSLVVSRVIAAPAADVLEAMQHVFPPILTLMDTIGEPATTGGLLRFEVAPVWSAFSSEMFLADIRQLDVALRPMVDRPQHTQVVVTAGLAHSRRLNRWIGSIASAVTATLGGGAGAGIGGSLLGLAGAGMILPIAAGTGVAGILSVAGFRRLYGWGLGRGLKGIDDLLRTLDVHLRTGGAFTTRSQEAPSVPVIIPPPPTTGG